ncbi:TOBE domain-containing protein [Tomitella biformata]|uniref:TOBE domain-containing protein n=1 Tax=Tomitella biformata TaxID=630403 RepID=UPI003F6F708C
MFPVRVTGLEARGETIRIRGAHGPELPLMAEVTVAAARELGLVVGDAVQFVVKATEVQIYPQSG